MNKINLLYVDDEPLNLQLFSMLFKEKFNVFTATSGKEGLKVLESTKNISIVISDMKMPEMSGIEFIKIAKKKFKEVKYFILTGFEINNEIQEALNENLIHSCLRKPFIPNDLEMKLNEVLNL